MEREEMVLDAVRELYQDFDLVVCLAKNSNVLNIKAQEHNWFLNYPIGLWISDYDVKLGEERREIQKQFLDIWLREISLEEAWEEDFGEWKTEEKRIKLLKKCYIPKYLLHKRWELRLKLWEKEDFKKEFRFYAEGNQMPQEMIKKYERKFKDAIILELGGSYGGDHVFLVAIEEMCMRIDFGIWD